MELIGSKTSPYVRKVRALLQEKGLAFDFVEDNAWNADTRVPLYNPLNKVPALVTESGESLYDSVVITEYADALGGAPMIPGSGIERARVRRMEALADGVADAGIALFLERKRDPSRRDEGWMERQSGKVQAGIAALSRDLGAKPWLAGDALSLADVAAGAALFWVEFRLPEIAWRAQYPNLKAWAERLEKRPSFASTSPAG